ncbi:MAG: hypothetical protein AMXMBFR81_22970 [Chthonomonas sp.]
MKPLDVRIRQRDFEALMRHLHSDGNEQHAFLLCGLTEAESRTLMTVREMMFADPLTDLSQQSPAYVSLRSSYALGALERAIKEGLHLSDVHSHPFCEDGVRFSSIDRSAARRRFEWHRERVPSLVSVGLVFGRTSVYGEYQDRATGKVRRVRSLEIVGQQTSVWEAGGNRGRESSMDFERFDRQVRAFGVEVQSKLQTMTIGVAGCGGTGSAVVQQLGHLGIRRFVLCDPDAVCESNLNRLIGAVREDAVSRASKANVAARLIRTVSPDAEVVGFAESVDHPNVRRAFAECDAVFGCGDNAGVRAVLTDIAARCLIPYFDLGVGIVANAGRIVSAGGQVVAFYPGGPCLGCSGKLNPVRVAEALRTPEERAVVEAAYGAPTPQPSVVGLNGVVASLAVGEFLKYASGWTPLATRLQHDAATGEVQRFGSELNSECPYCSKSGVLGRGLDGPVRPEWIAPIPEVRLEN